MFLFLKLSTVFAFSQDYSPTSLKTLIGVAFSGPVYQAALNNNIKKMGEIQIFKLKNPYPWPNLY